MGIVCIFPEICDSMLIRLGVFFTFMPDKTHTCTFGFHPDRIRTLVPMATDISHTVIMGKTLSPRFSLLFLIGNRNLFILAGDDDTQI